MGHLAEPDVEAGGVPGVGSGVGVGLTEGVVVASPSCYSPLLLLLLLLELLESGIRNRVGVRAWEASGYQLRAARSRPV